jgi:RNA polymerase sigma-70 factor (ECF subfamily)
MPQTSHQLDAPSTVARTDATALFKGYSPAVYRYCLKRLGSREEAEDAVQLTFLNAWRSLERGFEPDQPRPWLFQIAANVCSSSLRSKLGTARTELRDPVALDDMAAHERNGREELVGLPEALRLLPTRQRRALLLRDWQGLSYREIAADLAVSVASVETLLFRGRTKVATTLATANWRKVTPSMRAVVFWPFAFMRTKSLPVAGGEHVKLAVGLAAGTVAPLVAFGVVQGLLLGGAGPSDAARSAPGAGVAAARASGGWTDDASAPHRAAVVAVATKSDQPSRDRHDKGPIRPEKTDGADHPGGGTGEPTPPPTVPGEPATPPSAPGVPAPGPSAPAPQVSACVATGSETKPGVPVTISEYGLKGVPMTPGACG